MDCKFDGEDENKGDMIQCCLCNIWFHVECIMVTKTKGVTDRIIIEDTENNETTTTGPSSTAENLGVAHQPTDHSSLESQTTKLLDEQPEDTESQDPKSADDSEEVENYEDDIVTNSVSASDKSDTEGNVDGNIDDLNDKVWICENCKSLPSEIHKLKQSNMNIEKELKSIKDILEDLHKGSTNENKIEHKTQFQNNQGSSTETTPQPASTCLKKSLDDMKNKVSSVDAVELQPELPERETPPVTKTHDCCTNSSRKLHDNCKMNEQRLTGQHNEDEIASDLKTKRLIIEENIALKRENSHLKDRLSIMERILDQILRDHENKRKETDEERWKQPVKKMKVRKFDRHSKELTTQNRYEIISDESEDENSYCDEDPEVIEYRKDLTQRNRGLGEITETTTVMTKQNVHQNRRKLSRKVETKLLLLAIRSCTILRRKNFQVNMLKS